ncbi:hypothetical protein BDB01DRAFT_831652 [Pilobolus umbonatus]|nr:hypothetical protein BDB01DRAFT_831652 [Pilobolus umbonatus]
MFFFKEDELAPREGGLISVFSVSMIIFSSVMRIKLHMLVEYPTAIITSHESISNNHCEKCQPTTLGSISRHTNVNWISRFALLSPSFLFSDYTTIEKCDGNTSRS